MHGRREFSSWVRPRRPAQGAPAERRWAGGRSVRGSGGGRAWSMQPFIRSSLIIDAAIFSARAASIPCAAAGRVSPPLSACGTTHQPSRRATRRERG